MEPLISLLDVWLMAAEPAYTLIDMPTFELKISRYIPEPIPDKCDTEGGPSQKTADAG